MATQQPFQRRRKISLSRSTPDLSRLSGSPSITLEQATPTRSRMVPLSPTSQTSSIQTDSSSHASTSMSSLLGDSSTPFTNPPHHSHSRSPSTTSSSSTTSSTTSTHATDPPTNPFSPPHQARQPLTRSLSTAHLTSFAPPFYNRPPTPLPPSPSLTSLLRPSFSSTTTSRPTTPDESENDYYSSSHPTTTTTPHSQAHSGSGALTPSTPSSAALVSAALTAPRTFPLAAPKVPTYEYYGFALYITSSLCFLIYLLWSYLPSPFLHQLGITYYPNRWWALALPGWLVMLVVFVYVGVAAYNAEVLTVEMGDVRGVVDESGRLAVVDGGGRIVRGGGGEGGGGKGRGGKGKGKGKREEGLGGPLEWSAVEGKEWRWREAWSEGTDAVLDIPIGGVCEVLYGDG